LKNIYLGEAQIKLVELHLDQVELD